LATDVYNGLANCSIPPPSYYLESVSYDDGILEFQMQRELEPSHGCQRRYARDLPGVPSSMDASGCPIFAWLNALNDSALNCNLNRSVTVKVLASARSVQIQIWDSGITGGRGA